MQQLCELIACVRRANENAGNLISVVQFLIIQAIVLHSILFNYVSVHNCENSNILGRIAWPSETK